MDVDNLNTVLLYEPDQLEQPDGETQQKKRQTNNRMAIAKGHLQIKLKARKSPSGCLAGGEKCVAHVEKSDVVAAALQLSSEIANHVRDATNGFVP